MLVHKNIQPGVIVNCRLHTLHKCVNWFQSLVPLKKSTLLMPLL